MRRALPLRGWLLVSRPRVACVGSGDRSHRPDRGAGWLPRLTAGVALRVAVALAAAAFLTVACRTAAPAPGVPLPDPLAAPLAGAPLGTAEVKAARAAAAAAARGEVAAATKQAGKLPADHPVRGLILLEARFAARERVAGAALQLAAANEGYAAAWSLAALAASREGSYEQGLTAARRAVALRLDDPGRTLVSRLEGEVVTEGMREASELLARGDGAGAYARAGRVLELVPGADDARVLAARAALASGQPAKAAELVPALPDTPAAIEVKGRVSESLGQWELAADFYGRLPEGYPGRCELLMGAREQVRLSLAPPYLSQALAEPELTRRGLAVILAFEAPALADRTAGSIPVYEDVVGLPEARDIVVAVRSGVMSGDSIARRFGPRRHVTQRELVATLERLTAVLGRPAPTWCAEGAPAGECLPRPATLDGRFVAGLVRSLAGQEGGSCTPR